MAGDCCGNQETVNKNVKECKRRSASFQFNTANDKHSYSAVFERSVNSLDVLLLLLNGV